jgi:RNase P subunit RPR2
MTIFYDKGKGELRKKISQNQREIWGSVFKIDKPVMKMKGYHFESLQTDGIGVSICFQKNGLSDAEKKKKTTTYEPMHLNELDEKDLSLCRNKKLVVGDPGKRSLQLLDNKRNELRYSTGQRRSEQRINIDQRIMNSEKENYHVTEEETKLSACNGKTVDYQRFKEYIKMSSQFNQKTDEFYQQVVWRNLKWKKWINMRRSEDQFLNRIKETYGAPEDILICYGDWSQTHQMKYLLPSQGVGLRRLISKRYHLVLVDEFRTSKLCSHCHHPLVHHKVTDSSNKEKELYRVLVCLDCKNDRSESICRFFNRDINACINMLYLTQEWLSNGVRPEEYRRETTLTTSVENLGSL